MNTEKQDPIQELLDGIRNIIIEYNDARGRITDDGIKDMRAELSSATYALAEAGLQAAYSDMISTEIALERADGTVFMEYYNEYRKTKSESASESLARKTMKTDERYLSALEAHGRAKQYAYLLGRVLDQANHVMNSMAKKTKNS